MKKRFSLCQSFRRYFDKCCSSFKKNSVNGKDRKILIAWIDNQINIKGSVVDGVAIWSKALDLFSFILNKDGQLSEKIDFQASKGWLENFKHCFNLHNVKLQREAGSSDKETAEKFKPQFLKFIEERSYILQQVFNVDETSLFYKRMGQRTYITKTQKVAPVFKAFKDRLILLSCRNHQVTWVQASAHLSI